MIFRLKMPTLEKDNEIKLIKFFNAVTGDNDSVSDATSLPMDPVW